MKSKELTLEERKSLQLEMLDEIDSFCRASGIKYALSCGTLIGAVRHKGFIPWDDDADITMLFDDMLRFRDSFCSKNIKYCDIETDPNYGYHFSRIISNKTYSKVGLHRSYGVCIDLYPIIECSGDRGEIDSLLKIGKALFDKRMFFLKWSSRVQRFTPFSVLPGYTKAIRDYYNFMVNNIQKKGGGYYYQMGGPLFGKNNNFYHNLWPFNPLGRLIEAQFEGSKYYIPEKYDEMLKVRYGNYMSLPPKEERIPYHGEQYFWKQ